jgi:CRP-like cAMP-binding protein
VYFIKSGSVSLVLTQYNNFKFLEIQQGYYFGEVELLFEEIRQYTYLAETDCELLCITKKNFQRIFFEEFREIGNQIYHDAYSRKFRTRVTYNKALKFCKKTQQQQEDDKKSKGKQGQKPESGNGKLSKVSAKNQFKNQDSGRGSGGRSRKSRQIKKNSRSGYSQSQQDGN